MNRKLSLLFITFTLLLCSLPLASTAQRTKVRDESTEAQRRAVDPETPSTKPQAKARVDFMTPTSVEAAIGAAQQQGLKVAEVRHNIYLGDQTFVGFYPVPDGAGSAEVRSGLAKAYRLFLQDMIKSAQQQQTVRSKRKPVGDAMEILQQESLEIMTANFREALAAAPYAEPHVIGITVEGSQRAIEGVKEAGPAVEAIEMVPSGGQLEPAVSSMAAKVEMQSLAAASASWENWVPESGVITSGQSDQSNRYINISMIWDDVSGFGDGSTFEPDFFLNNDPNSSLGRGVYLDTRQTLDKIPVAYAATNLPTPYVDTRLDDPSTEVAFTIGSARAKDIRANNAYYTYFRTKNGTAARDNAKFTAQLGYRRPSWCNTTWCSYGSHWERIFGAWAIPIPGKTSFRK